MAAKRHRPSGKPAKTARRVLIAGRVLEILGNGGLYEDVVAEFGVPRHPVTKAPLNAEQLIDWATRAFLDDEPKRIGAARVLAELQSIAYADPGHYAQWDEQSVSTKSSATLTAAQRKAVAEVAATEYGVRLKFHNKTAALQLLGNYYGLANETGNVTAPKEQVAKSIHDCLREIDECTAPEQPVDEASSA